MEPQGKVHLIMARRLFIAAAESKARSTGVVDGSALQSRLFTHSAGSVGCTSTSRATAAELSAPQQINLSASCTTSPTATSVAPIRDNFFSARTNGFPRAFPNSLQLPSAFTSSRPCCWSQTELGEIDQQERWQRSLCMGLRPFPRLPSYEEMLKHRSQPQQRLSFRLRIWQVQEYYCLPFGLLMFACNKTNLSLWAPF